MYRIALDSMGGDDAPGAPVAGAAAALRAAGDELEILAVGDPEAIRCAVGEHPEVDPDRFRILPAREMIEPQEPPALAVRRKRDSSIVVGLETLRRGEADAFVSAGSTGAVMAASLLILGPLPGVDRPAVGAMFPTSDGPTLVLDVGANVGSRPEHLHQFARLGSMYVRDLRRVAAPRVGLLNVGEEAKKGDDLAVATYRLLHSDPVLHFVGNVEGHEIIQGRCEVLVCDGFAGNVLLKFYESVAGFVLGLLHGGSAGADAELREIFRFLDYAEYGGAPLLGVDGVSIICHGASSPRAMKNAIGVAVEAVRSEIIRDMTQDLERLRGGGGRE
ncbi:MAG: phosphate acyltransferase PlsX [Gemmatimonadota bacterium]